MKGAWIGLLAIFVSVEASSHTIVVPTRIMPGIPLPLGFTFISPNDQDVHVQVDLIKNEHERVASVEHVFKQGSPGIVNISVPKDLEYQYQYKLIIHGLAGVYFIEEVRLMYDSSVIEEKFAILIQTDKATYKPGQTVRFRTFGMFSNMTVFTGALNVSISDPKGNKIKQWYNVTNKDYGVVENFMLVDTEPILGDWRIDVKTNRLGRHNNQVETKTFTIAQYVLPKFDVHVVTPPYILTSDKDLQITVNAKYTYGKPVEGTVLVRADLDYGSTTWRNDPNEVMVETNVTINGEVDITIPLTRIATEADLYSSVPLISKLDGYHVVLTVIVTESINNLTRQATGSTQFYSLPYVVKFYNDNPSYFKPGLPYTAYATITQPDGRPIFSTDQDIKLVTYYKYFVHDVNKQRARTLQALQTLPERQFSAPPSGTLKIVSDTPANADSLHFEVHYKGLKATLNINKYISTFTYSHVPSTGDIQITMVSTGAVLGDDVEFNILSVEPMRNMQYIVVSNRRTVVGGEIVSENKTSINFKFPVSAAMEPYAHLVVYYFHNSSIWNADSIYFNLNDNSAIFKNKVNLDFNATTTEPGNAISLHIQTDPRSMVNLLAVDQSVLLMKTGNDIEQEDVVAALKTSGAPSSSFAALHTADGIFRYTDGLAIVSDVYGFGYSHLKRQIDCEPTSQPSFLETPTASPGVVTGQTPTAQPGLVSGQTPTVQPGIVTGETPTAQPGLVSRQTPTAQPGLAPGGLPAVKHVRMGGAILFGGYDIRADGNVTYSVQVPDTITTWVASAFSISKTSGLGIADAPAEFKTFRPFFVSLNLPYSVVRGEEVILQANVFNYFQQDLQVIVTLEQSKSFKVIIPKDTLGNMEYKSEKVVRHITVPSGHAKAVFIPILPTVIGKVDISVKAQSVLSADGVRRQLLVKPEGVEMEYNHPLILSSGENITVSIATPPTFVQDSLMVHVSVIGDNMGPSVKNMNNLLRMPTGCGEQTMSSMAPDIFITQYLETSGQLTDDIRDMATSYMERGYQRELTFQRRDGSFSIWGESDSSGSMWLTAFVVKSFHQARRYIYVSDDVISRALAWMARYIDDNGQVQAIGHVHDSMLQGGASNHFSLSAFTLLALLENEDVFVTKTHLYMQQKATVIRAYLETNLHAMTSVYDLAITSYALARAGSSHAAVAYSRLDRLNFLNNGLKYWPINPITPTPAGQVPAYHWSTYYQQTPPVDIEVAAYGLLYLIESKNLVEGLPVLKWLLSKRNANGGFSSTQDTVVALQAISEYQSIFNGALDLDVSVAAGHNFTHMFNVQATDAMVLKTTMVPKSSLTSSNSSSVPSQVSLAASGKGSVLAQVSVSLHVEKEVLTPSFNVTSSIIAETSRSVHAKVCVSTIKFSDVSGMSVVEFGLPTGFTAEMETSNVHGTRKTEIKDGKIVLYYDQITFRNICADITMIRTELVAKTQPVPVRVYDYYQPERRALTFYEPSLLKGLSFCDICAECGC